VVVAAAIAMAATAVEGESQSVLDKQDVTN